MVLMVQHANITSIMQKAGRSGYYPDTDDIRDRLKGEGRPASDAEDSIGRPCVRHINSAIIPGVSGTQFQYLKLMLLNSWA